MTADLPLRVLMVTPLPPVREYGAVRAQLELADHLRALGHQVDLLTRDDVCAPRDYSGRIRGRFPVRFPVRVIPRLRRIAAGYDVIDAIQGAVPLTKAELGFDGLLVARSVGLTPMYHDYLRSERTLFPTAYHGTRVGRLARAERARRDLRDALDSYARSDMVNASNADEAAWLDRQGITGVVVIPHGIAAERQRRLQQLARPAQLRLDGAEVTFIGAWSLRKGADDLPGIWRRIRAARPDARLRLLGVGAGAPRLEAAEIVESYTSDELPGLLAGGAVGVFPSYIEGFPFSVLEQLSGGTPVVAYDAPGSREALHRVDAGLLVAPGDPDALADRALQILALDPVRYATLAGRCRAVAGDYTWESVAAQTVSAYRAGLARLHADDPGLGLGSRGESRPPATTGSARKQQ